MATYQHGYDRRTAFQLLKQGGPFWWKFSHWARPFDDQKIRAMLAAEPADRPGVHEVSAVLRKNLDETSARGELQSARLRLRALLEV